MSGNDQKGIFMKKSRLKLGFIAAVIAVLSFCVVSCDTVKIKDYPAVGTSFEYKVDDSIPLYDPEDGYIANRSRGFRGEAYINLGTDEGYPGSGENYYAILDEQLERYASDGITLLQIYVYLGKYCDTDIPDSAFEQLKEYFETVRDKGVKILLRFAYETESSEKGPRTKDIERHCRQIKAFISDNEKLFCSVVYAVQLGMIGLWGEGHTSINNIDEKRVIVALADAIPESVPLMVRTPELLSKVPDELESRFGVHDDFLVGYDHEWGMMSWEDENYDKLLKKCKYTVTDGEMPWGRSGEKIDIVGLVGQCVGYGLTSLSIEHNYKEDGNAYCLEECKSIYLTEAELKGNAFPYNPSLLVDGKISVYDYLRYHLGYQLVASNLTIGEGKASFMITNYGFACPYNYEMEIYVDGQKVESYDAYDFRDLVQFGQKIYEFNYNGGEISVRFVNGRDTSDVIRLYNDIPFTADGMNVIYAD